MTFPRLSIFDLVFCPSASLCDNEKTFRIANCELRNENLLSPTSDLRSLTSAPRPSSPAIIMNKNERTREKGIGLVLIAALCWSTSGVWIISVMEISGISAIDLAFWRDFVTFLILLTGVGVIRPSLLRVKRRDLPWLFIMGAIGIGTFHALWNLSAMLNGAAIATVLQYIAPVLVTIAAWALWREPLTWQKISAVFLTLIGVVLIAMPSAGGGMEVTAIGVVVGVASAVAISLYNLVGKRLTGQYSPWTVVTYMFGFGALTLFPFALFTGSTWTLSPAVLALFAGFVLVPTLGGFGSYTFGLPHLQASVAAIIATAEVLFAAIVAYFALGERLDTWQLLGMALVVAGVVLVSWPRRWRLRRPGRERAVSP